MNKLVFNKNTKEKREWSITIEPSHSNDILWCQIAKTIHEKMGCKRNDFSQYDCYHYGWGLILRFKNNADEAQFIMLSSSGAFDDQT